MDASFWIKAVQLIMALSLLVVVHEFGHYIFARMFGMRVTRFYMFFNWKFSLLKWYPDRGRIEVVSWSPSPGAEASEVEAAKGKRQWLLAFNVGKPRPSQPGKSSWRDTLFGLGWIPLGGYCDIAGMIDETTTAEQLSKTPERWEFRGKPAWQRLLVMSAGVLFNFLLAIVIYIGIAWHWGEEVIQFRNATEGYDYAEQFHNIGFEDGDQPLTLNGKPLDSLDPSAHWDMVQDGAVVGVLRHYTDTVLITIPDGFLQTIAQEKMPMSLRIPVVVDEVVNGEPAAAAGMQPGDRIVAVGQTATPSYTEFAKAMQDNAGQTVTLRVLRDGQPKDLTASITEGGKLGFKFLPPAKVYPVDFKEYSLLESIPRGWELGTTTLGNYVSSLKLIFTKEGAQSVGGFGAIGNMFAPTWNWLWFWQMTAFLSVILAVMNILPIPALDGGHIMFTLWEIITRRKPSEKFLGVAQTIGIGFLLLLLVYANLNDVLRLFR